MHIICGTIEKVNFPLGACRGRCGRIQEQDWIKDAKPTAAMERVGDSVDGTP